MGTVRHADAMTSIDVRDLTKEYGAGRAVDDLTFTVPPGRVTGFLGPNGAGKSTTLRLVLGLDARTLVMVADPEYLAIRVYRSVGFADTEVQIGTERKPEE